MERKGALKRSPSVEAVFRTPGCLGFTGFSLQTSTADRGVLEPDCKSANVSSDSEKPPPLEKKLAFPYEKPKKRASAASCGIDLLTDPGVTLNR